MLVLDLKCKYTKMNRACYEIMKGYLEFNPTFKAFKVDIVGFGCFEC